MRSSLIRTHHLSFSHLFLCGRTQRNLICKVLRAVKTFHLLSIELLRALEVLQNILNLLPLLNFILLSWHNFLSRFLPLHALVVHA